MEKTKYEKKIEEMLEDKEIYEEGEIVKYNVPQIEKGLPIQLHQIKSLMKDCFKLAEEEFKRKIDELDKKSSTREEGDDILQIIIEYKDWEELKKGEHFSSQP